MAAVAMMVNAPQFALAERQMQIQKQVQPAHDQHDQEVAADLKRFEAKYNELTKWEKYGEFFDHMKKEMHPKYVESFLSKSARTDWRDRAIPGMQVSGNIVILTHEGQSLRVEVLRTKEVLARVNGVDFTHEDLPNPDTFWKKVEKAVAAQPTARIGGFYGLIASLMVSKAHAGLMMLLLGGLLGWMLAGMFNGGGNSGHNHHRAGSNY